MEKITAYPLVYPAGSPRTPAGDRRSAQFGSRNGARWGKSELTLHQAVSRVFEQLRLFTKVGQEHRVDMDDVVISTNVPTRIDGLPKSGQARPTDPGAAVYFILDGQRQCVPCDTYLRVEDNIAAIASTIECLRTMERHGAQMLRAAMTGFRRELPAPGQVSKRPWRDVLDYRGYDFEEAKKEYKRRCGETHPDRKGGCDDAFNEVQNAWEQAQQELKR